MQESPFVEMTTSPLSLERAFEAVARPACGAVDFFVGTVRNNHEGEDVTGITYEAHPLAKKMLADICLEAAQQWSPSYYYAAHYVGALPVGGISVILAVSSPHRTASFEACRFVIESIKQKLPVWKQEHYVTGKSLWLKGSSLEK